MLEILQPYIGTITFLIALTFNVLLIFLKSPWYVYIIANVLLVTVVQLIGIQPFDMIGTLVSGLVDAVLKAIRAIFAPLSGCSVKSSGDGLDLTIPGSWTATG